MNAAARAFNSTRIASYSVSTFELLNLFAEVEDLLKRIADTDDLFLRRSRAQVLSKLIAVKETMIGD
jgi:hypothetical protein